MESVRYDVDVVVQWVLGMHKIEKGDDKDSDHVNANGNKKCKEVTVVSSAYAIVHPGAVMIESLERDVCMEIRQTSTHLSQAEQCVERGSR